MAFNTLSFLVFLAFVLLLQSFTRSWKVRKVQLLLASYLFYAAWNPPFVLLLWISTAIDAWAANRIDATARTGVRRLFLLLSLATNLGLLGFFKYADFLMENVAFLIDRMGGHWQPPDWEIVLPIGISFYTFQSLSYTLDVYFRRMRPWPSFLDFALYVSFFPQLVAGPIVRSGQFLPQCEKPNRLTGSAIAWGLTLLVVGLFQKIVLADAFLAPIVEKVYDVATLPSTLEAWTATFAFGAQIFFDFAGYSTCAVGVAAMLGFRLPINFRAPYAASDFSDFWRRWHITLSTWLRDYLYIPLGGSRQSLLATAFALMITMTLGGLWHGAAWTFVFWGAGHGLLLVAGHAMRPFPWLSASNRWERGCSILVTFLIVTLLWSLFRAETLSHAFHLLNLMLLQPGAMESRLLAPWEIVIGLGIPWLLFGSHLILRNREPYQILHHLHWWWRACLIALLIYFILTSSGRDHAFIYFQF